MEALDEVEGCDNQVLGMADVGMGGGVRAFLEGFLEEVIVRVGNG